MAIDTNIVNFGQQRSPLLRGLSEVAQGAGAIRAGLDRRDQQAKIARQREAYGILGQAFDDNADPEMTKQLFNKAREIDPELTFKVQQMLSKGQTAPLQQVKTKGLEGYVFDSGTGTFSIDPTVQKALSDKAALALSKGVELSAKDRQGINKDVTGLIKGSIGINNAAKSLTGLKQSSSPAAKLAAVFSFMKAMDPSSTVRESEQGQVYSAQGAADGLASKVNSLLGEGGLSDKGFNDLVNTANNLSNSAINASNEEVMSYLDTYENTIPENFKASLIKRIPVGTKTLLVEKNNAGDAGVEEPPKPTVKYNDNVNKYL